MQDLVALEGSTHYAAELSFAERDKISHNFNP
jgi:hypothetical protein